MDKDTRNAIRDATQDARGFLRRICRAVAGRLRRHARRTGRREARRASDRRQQILRARIVAAIEHKRRPGMTAKEAVADYLRDAAFTTLNRFVALKMLEARGLVQECITQGRGFLRLRERILRLRARAEVPRRKRLSALHRKHLRRAFDRGEGAVRPARSGVGPLATQGGLRGTARNPECRRN